jgi:hypothetical protein
MRLQISFPEMIEPILGYLFSANSHPLTPVVGIKVHMVIPEFPSVVVDEAPEDCNPHVKRDCERNVVQNA